MLQLFNVSKSYGDVSVLDDISLTISQGEFVSLVGLSGSGKTTLLKLMGGLLEPDSGEIHFQNEKLEGPNNKLLAGHEEIKLVFQDFALKLNMTVEENLNYALLGYEENYKKERVEELIELCGLDQLRERIPQQLSGGQKQRVAFSRALATEPEIILMDEPFSNLDPLTKHDLLRETRYLAKKTDTTIVLVTHDTRDAMEAADRILVLDHGKIVQQDDPVTVYNSPVSPQVARLFGIVNLISVEQARAHFNKDQECGVWAEDIVINSKGSHEGIIHDVIFAGAYNKLMVEVDEMEWVVIDSKHELKVGDSVNLSVDPRRIMPFG